MHGLPDKVTAENDTFFIVSNLLLIHFHYLKTTLSSQILQNRHRLDSWAGRLLTPEVPGSGAQCLQDQRGKCGNC